MKKETRELLTEYIRNKILLFVPDIAKDTLTVSNAVNEVNEVTADIVNMIEQAINEASVDIAQVYTNIGDN